jgi:hypothetical protein
VVNRFLDLRFGINNSDVSRPDKDDDSARPLNGLHNM